LLLVLLIVVVVVVVVVEVEVGVLVSYAFLVSFPTKSIEVLLKPFLVGEKRRAGLWGVVLLYTLLFLLPLLFSLH